MSRGRYLAAVGIGLVLIALTAVVIRATEMVTGRYVASGVPPIPAFAGLLFLVALRPAMRRLHPALALDRQQVLIVYAMMTVAVVLAGLYVVRAFLPHLVSLQYWSARYSALATFRGLLPSWYAPADREVVRHYFEGSRGEGVPWQAWLVPLLAWTPFFLALFVAAFSLVHLFRRQWIVNERLGFPLLYLPLSVSAEGEGGIGPLFQQPRMWVGFGIAAAFDALNILHAVHPAVPAPGFFYSFAGQFSDGPWKPLNTVMLFFMLEAIGYGYFLSLEVSFSAWFFYLLEKAAAVTGIAAGYDQPGFPFIQDQSAGAYLAAGLLIVWGARRALLRPLRFWEAGGDAEREARRAYLTLTVSLAFLLFWCWRAGMSLLVAAPFFAILFCFVLVYARLRAETGVPFEFVYPYGLPKELLVNTLTTRGILNTGGPRTFVLLSSLAWLSRHHYAESMAAYQIDSLKLSEVAQIPRRRMIAALTIALLFGLACALWVHLDAYHHLGSNVAGGGMGQGEYRAKVALQEYQTMATRAATPPPRDMARIAATGGGFMVVLALGIARGRLVGIPFHPLGFILATAYGDHTTIFFPMFVAWLLKAAVLKIGGLRAYRSFIPCALGLIVGHFLIAGIIWPALSLLLAPEASQSYHLYFGG
jgi:hypothetical protein